MFDVTVYIYIYIYILKYVANVNHNLMTVFQPRWRVCMKLSGQLRPYSKLPNLGRRIALPKLFWMWSNLLRVLHTRTGKQVSFYATIASRAGLAQPPLTSVNRALRRKRVAGPFQDQFIELQRHKKWPKWI